MYILALAVIRGHYFRPQLHTFVDKVVERTFGRERAGTDTVNLREIAHRGHYAGEGQSIAGSIADHFLIFATAQVIPEDRATAGVALIICCRVKFRGYRIAAVIVLTVAGVAVIDLIKVHSDWFHCRGSMIFAILNPAAVL